MVIHLRVSGTNCTHGNHSKGTAYQSTLPFSAMHSLPFPPSLFSILMDLSLCAVRFFKTSVIMNQSDMFRLDVSLVDISLLTVTQ